jgi:hypothetical protein
VKPPDRYKRAAGQDGTRPTAESNEAPKPTTRQPTGQLPDFLRDLIACPPQHGQGVHQWLYKVARQLHHHRDPETIHQLLSAAVDGCGRLVPDSEIAAAIASAAENAWKPNGSSPPPGQRQPKWPPLNPELRGEILASNQICLADLWDLSPTRIEGSSPDAEWFVDQLFPGDPLLCIGATNSQFATRHREKFRGKLSTASLIVPSPMSAKTGTTKTGKISEHALENTGPRKYLITEFDEGTSDEQSMFIHHLSQFAPLVMVLSSGGKSLHAWWKCDGVSEDATLQFFRYAVSMGADPATWTRSQFVRLPQGWRADKAKLQQVYFFNEANL